MKKILLLLFASTALIGGAAHAEMQGVYVEGQVGYNNPVGSDSEGDDTASFAGAVGYRAFNGIRLEAEVSYRENDYPNSLDLSAVGGAIAPGDGDISTTTFMLNAFYDFKNSSAFTPFVGVGLGAAYLDVNLDYTDAVNLLSVSVDDQDWAFVYQLAAGGSYAVAPNTDLTLSYRWLDTANADIGGISGDYRANEIRAGLRYTF